MFRRSIAIVVLGAVVALPAVAVAQEGDTPERPERAERIAVACARVDRMEERIRRALAVIDGDADTPGSLDWLESLAERADAAGRTERAEVIRARIDVRSERPALLELRLERLADLRLRCDEWKASP